jgi:hypothetical protein
MTDYQAFLDDARNVFGASYAYRRQYAEFKRNGA